MWWLKEIMLHLLAKGDWKWNISVLLECEQGDASDWKKKLETGMVASWRACIFPFIGRSEKTLKQKNFAMDVFNRLLDGL